MSLKLFDDLARNDVQEPRYADESYDFINRSARPEVARARDLLEIWYTRYCKTSLAEGVELALRCRREHFDSGFYELFLHELVQTLGGEVMIHPALPESTKRPDFGEVRGSDVIGYLEAHLVTDVAAHSRGKEKMKAAILDSLNEIQSADLFLDLEDIVLLSTRQPSVKRIRDGIQAEIDSLNADELIRTRMSPVRRYRDDNVQVDYRVFAKNPEYRGHPMPMIGGPPSEARHGYSDAPIRKAVGEKALKYGVLDRPMVLALNSIGKWIDEEDVRVALFGEGALLSDREKGWRSEPLKPGAFQPRSNTRVSAVLITHVQPWSLASADICIYHNPFARFPYTGVLCGLPQVRRVNNQWVHDPGRGLAEIFELPAGWPWEKQRKGYQL